MESFNIFNSRTSSTSIISMSVSVILGITLILVCIFFLLKGEWINLKKKYWRYRHLEKFQGPVAYPLIGTVPNMIFTDYYEWSVRMCKRWGDPLRLWKFGHPMVFISSYKYAIQLLSKPNFNGKMLDLDMIYRHPGGKGLSTTPAYIHPQRRKMLNPAFSRQVVEGSLPTFSEESKKLLESLKMYLKSREFFDIVVPSMTCLFRMVARSDFGDTFFEDGIGNDTDARQHMLALHTIAKNLSERILGPYLWQRYDFFYFHFTNQGRESKKARDVINAFANRALQNRRHYRKISSNSNPDTATDKCYLDVLLDLVENGKMTDEDVVSELNNFMGGAYDTTALTVCWTLFLLALNPSHQEKVYQELNEIFGDSPTHTYTITAADTKRMKYLELCLKESLRIFPPAPIFPRSTVHDMTLDDGRIIPAGVDVLIFANLIHIDPEYFPNPEEFQPERHLEPIPAFMPFSIGVRNCIGQVYGMYQSKVVLAYLLREYFWETRDTLESIKIAYQGLLYPAAGLYFRVKHRR